MPLALTRVLWTVMRLEVVCNDKCQMSSQRGAVMPDQVNAMTTGSRPLIVARAAWSTPCHKIGKRDTMVLGPNTGPVWWAQTTGLFS